MAALTFKLNPNSELHQMLVKLRKTFPPREINGGELHFNYTDLINAFRATQIFNKRNDHYKYTLFVNQALGYLQRGLPACDRQTVANGIIRTIHEKNVKRTFIYNPYSSAHRYDQGCFPITANDHSTDGLGYKFAALTPDQLYSCASYPLTSVGEYFEKYVNNKKENLLKHRNPLPQDQPRPMAYQPQIKLELPLPEPPEPQHPSQGPLNNLSCAEALLNLFDIQ